MKNFPYLFLAAAAWLLSACSADELIKSTTGDLATVEFNVQLPQNDLSTRAYSDGLSATYLTYGVYRKTTDGDYELVDEQQRKNQFVDHETSVSLQLLKGYDYKIVFWADAGPKCPYTLDLENATVTMDYATQETIAGNDEERDVFYTTEELTAEELTSEAKNIYLYRPLAQLNFGSDDLRTSGLTSITAVADIDFTVTIPAGYLPTTLNLLDGKGTGATEHAVKFVSTGVPAHSAGEFPVDGYEYVAMNYVLPGLQDEESDDVADKTVVTEAVTLTAQADGIDDITVSVSNLPLQRNYRTNIYGSLLTDPANFEISIDPRYWDDFFVMEYEGVIYYAYCTADMLMDAIRKGYNVALLCDMQLETSDTRGLGLVLSTVTDTRAATRASAISGDTRHINLNGHKLIVNSVTNKKPASNWTNNVVYYMITTDDEVNLSIVNGTLQCQADGETYHMGGIYIAGTSSLYMKDVTMEVDCPASDAYCVYNGGTGGVTLENCKLSANNTGSTCAYTVFNDYVYSDGNYLCSDMTLNNCELTAIATNISQSSSGSYGVYNHSNATIYVNDCDIQSTTLSSGAAYGVYDYYGYGSCNNGAIYVDGGNINVSASGPNPNSSYNNAHGVYINGNTMSVQNCNINVASEMTLAIYNGNSVTHSIAYGILLHSESPDLTVRNCDIYVSSKSDGQTGSSISYGIALWNSSGSATHIIDNCRVTAEVLGANSSQAYAGSLKGSGSLTVTNADWTALALYGTEGTYSSYAYGIQGVSYNNPTFTGGTITSTCNTGLASGVNWSTSTGTSQLALADYDINVTSGNYNAYGTQGLVNIDNCTANVAGCAYDGVYGVYYNSSYSQTVKDSKFNVSNTYASTSNTYGLYNYQYTANSSIVKTLTNCEFNVKSKSNSYGIYSTTNANTAANGCTFNVSGSADGTVAWWNNTGSLTYTDCEWSVTNGTTTTTGSGSSTSE